MWHNTVELTIDAPPEKVYAYLADLSRHVEWSSNVRAIELVSGAPATVGAEYRASEDVPRNLTSYARITALEPPQAGIPGHIAWQSTDHRVFRTDWEFRLEPGASATSTRLTQSVAFHPLNPLAIAILYLFRVPRVAAENRASLARIRKNLTGV